VRRCEAAARASQGGEAEQTNLDHRVAQELLTAAASYLIMGVMLGVAVVARRLGASPMKRCWKKRSRWSISCKAVV
jgi:hypothetical protein